MNQNIYDISVHYMAVKNDERAKSEKIWKQIELHSNLYSIHLDLTDFLF